MAILSINTTNRAEFRERFRAFPIFKTWEWGLGYNADRTASLLGCETGEYRGPVEDAAVTKVTGTRLERAAGASKWRAMFLLDPYLDQSTAFEWPSRGFNHV